MIILTDNSGKIHILSGVNSFMQSYELLIVLDSHSEIHSACTNP